MLVAIMLVSVCACNDDTTNDGNDNNDIPKEEVVIKDPFEGITLPDKVDYSKSQTKFDFSGYSSLSDGQIQYDEKNSFYVGESYVNKERIKEYFDSGMTYLFPQSTVGIGNNFQTSELKKVMDICVELGHKNSVVLTDSGLYRPYENCRSAFQDETDWSKISCIGSTYDWQFANEAELDEYVKSRLLIYSEHEAFGGVFLPDEPRGKFLKVVGETYKSVRRVQKELGIEDMFINANLLPYYANLVSTFPAVEKDFHSDATQRNHEAYRRYLETFLKESGSNTLQVDIYPMYHFGLYRLYLLNVQLMAEVAKEYGAKIVMVTQTAAFGDTRLVKYEDLNYLINMSMGFGAEQISYFTYFTHEFDGTNIFDENGSMVSTFGDKTQIYYDVQALNAQAQRLAPTILNFDYKTSEVLVSKNVTTYRDHIDIAVNYSGKKNFDKFTKLTSCEINKETAVVTELYDDQKDNYMYMVINAVDTTVSGSVYYQTANLTFAEEFNKALVYYNGEYKIYDLDAAHKLTVKMRPGEAHYIIPFAE